MNEGTIYIAVPPCLKDKTTRLFTYTDNGQIRSFTNQIAYAPFRKSGS